MIIIGILLLLYGIAVFFYTRSTYFDEYVKNDTTGQPPSFKKAYIKNFLDIAWVLTL
ncbi:hypothetical protein [Convivina praedatoris]|uniref:Uncharacterized protein n=1 Tax=Convivina praedatoris TaxID=2880963 RepID=A0ABM9D2S3_9LACO|nr:hypothetical protein [Convivina sp. LMG 32447]CAH1855934.1 hypothetical protein R077815_01320 [Convivina sp. LMG 32447]CAH1856542.1 hypothetical protein LMG032447_01310 [Convivina sp. LMG 32447]CAH1856940.1 hypothetical protein R078138_01473 [Convivina sp. LMG 32447]